MLVHDVVVLQDVFTNTEVVAFNLSLGRFDEAGEHFRFDGLVFRGIDAVHDLFKAVAGKEADDVVFGGNVELRATLVPLTTGTAAQLIVDTTGFVAFGTDNVQAAGGDDLFFFGVGFHLDFVAQIAEALSCCQDFFVVGFEIAVRRFDHFVFKAFSGHFFLGHVLGIAPEDDVGPTTGHVGGDGHGAVATGLGDDFGFLFVALGV